MLTCTFALAFAQDQPEPKKEITELKLNLNDDGSHYIKATFLNQVWFRFNESNPGTTILGQTPQSPSLPGDPKDKTFDIGLRRTRFQLYGMLTDHVGFYFQFGQNNFNYLAGQNSTNSGNRKFQAFFHDALAEYRIKKNSDILYLGGGLTITNGLSRFSQPSISSIMSLDVPVFAQATVDQTDEFSRKLSVYARGQVGPLNYRLVMSDPFPITSNGSTPSIPGGTLPLGPNATFAYNHHYKQYQGFFMWNFLDKEPMTTPYMAGTYLGKRKVLNLEAGFITQKDATWTMAEFPAFTPQYHDMKLWSIALFYDAPIDTELETAFNTYVGYFYTDYGPGYLRYNGSMNPANGSNSGTAPPGSFGNAYPMFGTGNVVYGQVGLLLRKDLLGEHGTLLPFITVQRATYNRLNEPAMIYDAGVNWLIKGHNSKISLDWQVRPTYSLFAATPLGQLELRRDFPTKSQIVLQYQIMF